MVSHLRIVLLFLVIFLTLEFLLASYPEDANRMILNIFMGLPDEIKRWSFNNLSNINTFAHICFIIFSVVISYLFVFITSLFPRNNAIK